MWGVIVSAGCAASPVSVRAAAAPQADLRPLRSFAMLQPNRPVHSEEATFDPFVLQRLRQLTYLSLKERGYLPSARSRADFLVGVVATRNTSFQTVMTRSYFYDPYFPSNTWSTQVVPVAQAVVVLEVLDTDRRTVLWRGTGTRSQNDRLGDVELKQVVDAILDRFTHQPAASK